MYQTKNLFHFQFQIGFQVPSSKLEKSHELKTQNENMYQTSPSILENDLHLQESVLQALRQ